MTPKWRKLDLEGGGLQAANLRLARTLRRRAVAWALLAVFPLGLHRWYLGQRRSAALFPLLTATCGAAIWFAQTPFAMAALLALGALLVRDMLTLEQRITAVNKKLRMAAYLGQDAAAPPGYRGRFEPAPPEAPAPRRLPTLAEQEALLRDIARRRSP
jgi:TM2 domain-containing membrane protein YozV